MFDLNKLLRNNIRQLVPYSSARDEFKGTAQIFLDANENSFGSPLPTAYNRYPDPMQWKVKYKLADIKGVPPQHIFLGNGSDEVIDVLYRALCNPGVDNVILCRPTYGMYEVREPDRRFPAGYACPTTGDRRTYKADLHLFSQQSYR